MKDSERNKIMAVVDEMVKTAYHEGWLAARAGQEKSMESEKTDVRHESARYKKYIGMKVYAGVSFKGYFGTIVDTVQDEYDPNQTWFVVEDEDGFLGRWDITELKEVRTVTKTELVDLV